MSAPITNSTRLRDMLGESIPLMGSAADTYFTDDQISDYLTRTGGDLSRAAYLGWSIKAAYYVGLITISEGNALRQMSDLYDHAKSQMQLYASGGGTLVSGRTRVGRIRRRAW